MTGMKKVMKQSKANIGLPKIKLDRIKNVHIYLENLDYVGKVLSFYSIIEIATKLNNNKELGTLEIDCTV